VVIEGEASLVKVRVEFAEPEDCGLKVTVNDLLCPAAIVTGRVSPLIVKRELLLLAAVTVTLAPVALRLPDAVPLLPTVTLPTLMVEGVTLSTPVATTEPVPSRSMFRFGFDASESIVMLPLTVPAD
jgi:hypothetical protein